MVEISLDFFFRIDLAVWMVDPLTVSASVLPASLRKKVFLPPGERAALFRSCFIH